MQEFYDFLKQAEPRWDVEKLVIHKLFGQASSRQYFRVQHHDEPSKIIMKIPGGFSSPAEEITKIHADAPKEFPFLNIAQYLSDLDLPVPSIFHYDAHLGLVLLEDLGDESFEALVHKAGESFRKFYYQKAIDVLIHLQMQTLAHPSQNCIAYYRNFDADLLNWEFYHFLEYGVEDRLKVKVDEKAQRTFLTETHKLTQNILAMPQGFVHRDFQSRNIMFSQMDFYLIDFQDALIGPVLYDLVALLRDSYIHLSPAEVDELIEYYAQKLPQDHPYAQRKEEIRDDFYTITLQRKLKDAGRFQYIDTVRKNPNFLVHIPWTLEFIKHAFQHVPQAQALHSVLSQYVQEFR